MKGLLIKDFKLLKNQKQFFIIMLIVSLLIGFGMGEPSFIISYLTVLLSLFATSTISYDTYDNGMPFLFTLPISRKIYVGEKYVFGLLDMLISLTVSCILAVFGYVVKGQSFDHGELFFLVVSTFCIVTLMLSLSLPIQLKFGPEKSRFALLLSYGICFALIFGLFSLLKSAGVDTDALLTNLSSASPLLFCLGALLLCGSAGVISYLVSLKIMEKKEF